MYMYTRLTDLTLKKESLESKRFMLHNLHSIVNHVQLTFLFCSYLGLDLLREDYRESVKPSQ